MQEEKKSGIRVTIQEVDRLDAILELSQAINKVATALSCVPEVSISGCHFAGVDIGMQIDTSLDITETLIRDVD